MGDDPSSPRSFNETSSRARDGARPESGVHNRPKRLRREALLEVPPSALHTSRRSILIVDGSPATREAIAELLREQDFAVYAADGMGEMERVCRTITQAPELALLEFRLRDGRGDWAAAGLRARWANVFIVYLSCLAPEYDAALEASLRAPGTALLLKPTSLEAILQAVTRG